MSPADPSAARAMPPRAGVAADGADDGVSPATLVLLLVVAGVWGWWAWRQGAFFEVVLYPGTIVLLGVLVTLLASARFPGRLRGPAAVAQLALIALGAWTLLSIVWTPARDVAIQDTAYLVAYATSFGLGVWICMLLGRRVLLSAAPLALAAAGVAIATLATLWVGDEVVNYLDRDGTLRFPLGYRNAVAAFFLIAVFPIISIASHPRLAWWPRALLLGAGTLSIELVVLCQSRGSLFAAMIAIPVFVAVSAGRLRALLWLALAALAALPALPALLDVFQAGGDNTAASIGPLRDASRAMVVGAAIAVALGALVVWAEGRLWVPWAARRAAAALVAAAVGVAVLAAGVALATTEGGPFGFVERQVEDLKSAGTPELRDEGTRFGLNLGSNRGDFWRVALDDAVDHPLLGVGAGGWQFSYLRDRDSHETPDDPHSVEMLLLSELGFPGLALFVVFCVAAVVAALRSRRLGSGCAALSAAALGAGAAWLVQTSVDWLWIYPAVTAPVMMLLGAAAAPALPRSAAEARGGGLRLIGIAGLAVVAVALVLPLLSARYTNKAIREAGADLEQAYDDLDRAQDLNPFADRPALAEAAIAEGAGDDRRALAALREAEERKPEYWGTYYLAARLLAESDPAAAEDYLRRARELNPRSERVGALGRRIERARAGG